MSSRRIHLAPTFQLIHEGKEMLAIEREIAKLKPETEITLEGMTEIAKGKIVEWHPQRHFFVVKWEKKSTAFEQKIESRSELRAFFKAKLFSTQLVFKTMTVRRPSEDVYHFRIPEQLYQQQQRGALRVPIITKNATLITPQGEFEILDLSVGGAKLKLVKPNAKVRLGTTLMNCELKLGRKKISNENFGVKITFEGETSLGCRFAGFDSEDKVLIKQFLVESLRTYYKEEL